MEDCPDCHVNPEFRHESGCDVARCHECGWQHITCGCIDETMPTVWKGEFPGLVEVRKGLATDLNHLGQRALSGELQWDRNMEQWVPRPFIIAGTGMRNIAIDPRSGRKLVVILEHYIKRLVKGKDSVLVISGGAEGFDYYLTRAALKAGIPYTLYLPHPGYVSHYWKHNSVTKSNREHVAMKMVKRAHEVRIISETVYRGGVHSNFIRNDLMAEHCDVLLAFGHTPGTQHCRDAAKRLHRKIIDIPISLKEETK